MRYLYLILQMLLLVQLQAQSPLRLEEIMQGPDFVGHLPEGPYWSSDGNIIYFQWNRDTLPGNENYQYDLSSDHARALTDEEVLQLVPASGIYSKNQNLKLFGKNGDLFLQELSGGQVRQITNTLEREIPRGFSGDDREIIFERNNNLYSWSILEGNIEQLTQFISGTDKPEDKLTEKESWLKRDQLEYFEILRKRHDEQEFRKVRSEKLTPKRPKEIFLDKDNLVALSFSPDLRFIAGLREKPGPSDPTNVPDYVTESGYTKDLPARSKVGGIQSTYQTVIYDRIGDTLLTIDPRQITGVYDKPEFMNDYLRGPEIWVDTFEKPREVIIHPPVYNETGNRAVVVVRSQDNKDRWIMELNPENASLKLIDRQRDEAWIGGPGINGYNFSTGNIGFIDDGTLWFQSERTGYSHIYTYRFGDRKIQPLTEGNFEILDAVLSLDKQTFFVHSNKENPFENHFYHVSVPGGGWTRITARPGNHQVVVSPDEKRLAILYSYSNQPDELYWMENKPGAELHQVTESTTESFKNYSWRDPDIIHFSS